MRRSFILSVLLISAGFQVTLKAEDLWTPSTLSDRTIEVINQQTLVYHQCLDRQIATFNQPDFDSRDASNHVLKQCENRLDPIRDALLKEHVPREIADRYLLRKRHQAARQVLKYMIFAASQQSTR